MSENKKWVGTWASAQYSIEANNPSAPPLEDSSFRQFIRVSLGGEELRFTFSNEYGESDLEINSVYIAKPVKDGFSGIDLTTDTPLSFNGGSESVRIAAGERAITDPVHFPVSALDKIAISTYFGKIPSTLTHHAASRSNSFLVKGNVVSNETMDPSNGASVFVNWYALSNVDVLASENCSSIICFGDSITDGYGTEQTAFGNKPDSYLRWPDVFMEMLKENNFNKHSVINMGIGGNAIFGGQGPAARDRFYRDVLEQSGAGYFIFMIGVNDILRMSNTNMELAGQMIYEYEKMIDKAAEKNIKVYAGTITPLYGNGTHTTVKESIRKIVNTKLRQMHESGRVQGLIDFDKHLSDNDPYLPRYKHDYNRDGTHPNNAGYKAMGELVYSILKNDLISES